MTETAPAEFKDEVKVAMNQHGGIGTGKHQSKNRRAVMVKHAEMKHRTIEMVQVAQTRLARAASQPEAHEVHEN